MVQHFKANDFEKYFYELEKDMSIADFKQVYFIPKLESNLEDAVTALMKKDAGALAMNLSLLKKQILKEQKHLGPFKDIGKLEVKTFTPDISSSVTVYLDRMKTYYQKIFEMADKNKEKYINFWMEKNPKLFNKKKNECHNDAVSEIVKKIYEKNKIVQYKDELIQQVDPIYLDPSDENPINFRAHFFAPRKFFAGVYFETFWFNICIIWLMTVILYVTLYFEYLKKILNIWERIRFLKKIKKS
jgi:ABC transport system ATP-binding/permease protein